MSFQGKFYTRWFPRLVIIAVLLPIPWLILDYMRGNLTAEPIRGAILRTGMTALVLLILSLSCTPLNSIFGFKPALRVRRILGDYSFVYSSLHFALFVALDFGFNLELLAEELFLRPYALTGLVAGVLLIPLAVTSFPPWPARLGRSWKRLHRVVYIIAILSGLHFILVVKQGVIEPYLWMILIIFLLVLRLPPVHRFLRGIFTRAR